MQIEVWIGIIGLVSGTVLAIVTLYYSNKNNQKQILISKLEEIFELVQVTSRKNYMTLKELEMNIEDLRSGEFENLRTLNDYYKKRDQVFPEINRNTLYEQLSRLEVLSECYTNNDLKVKLSEYNDLMLTLLSFVAVGGNIYKEIHYKKGFPDNKELKQLVLIIKNEIIKKIKN